MNKRIKRWEIALGVGLLAAVLTGAFWEQTGRALSDNLLRLHVVARSDAASDQALKLLVRDEVLGFVTPMLSGVQTPEDAERILADHLDDIEETARKTLRAHGCGDPVHAGLARTAFPTKTYDGFALPAGTYDALRIVIGEGQGQNWWCVVFPPLCMAAAEKVTSTAKSGGLNDSQIHLITEDTETYVFTFQCLEWWNSIKMFFTGA